MQRTEPHGTRLKKHQTLTGIEPKVYDDDMKHYAQDAIKNTNTWKANMKIFH